MRCVAPYFAIDERDKNLEQISARLPTVSPALRRVVLLAHQRDELDRRLPGLLLAIRLGRRDPHRAVLRTHAWCSAPACAPPRCREHLAEARQRGEPFRVAWPVAVAVALPVGPQPRARAVVDRAGGDAGELQARLRGDQRHRRRPRGGGSSGPIGADEPGLSGAVAVDVFALRSCARGAQGPSGPTPTTSCSRRWPGRG